MSEPVVLKNSLAILVVATLQAAAPAVIAVGSLYAILLSYGVPIDQRYHYMAVLVALLALLLPRPPRTFQSQLHTTAVPIAMGVVARWMALLVVLLVIGYATKFSAHYSRRAMATWALMAPTLIVVVTLALNEIMRRFVLDPANARKTVLAGCTESSIALAKRLSRATEYGMGVVGFFDDRGAERLGIDSEVQLLGKLSDLAAYVQEHDIEVIFIALPVKQVSRVMDLVEELRDTTASIYYLPDLILFDLIQARSIVIDGIPAVSMCETPFFGYRAIAKRVTDVLISGSVLILAAPLMIPSSSGSAVTA
jgi:putative colanic acid biosynthesis UDP-glucose lipid carrier transferase